MSVKQWGGCRQMTIFVRARSAGSRRGTLHIGQLIVPCALGRSGCRALKREGDGATPIGVWRVRQVLYRADRERRFPCDCPIKALRPQDGWCDAPQDANYNRPVRHPYPASAEHLWRGDNLYDVIVVLGYNDRPRRRGRGSAIFLHVARPELAPTEGCIAVRRGHLSRIVGRLAPRTVVRVLC